MEVVIESVNVVVTPKGRNEWIDNDDTLGTSEEKRKKFLDTFTRGLFNELIVSFTAILFIWTKPC